MSKFHAYKYKKGDVTLEFSFPENEKIEQSKKDFRDLLLEAANDLALNK